jgi:hypothetical protein
LTLRKTSHESGIIPELKIRLNKLTYRGKNWFTVLYIHVNNTIFTRCFTIVQIFDKPIYKNKGDPNNLDNYRAICLTSNMGKLFTSLLNSRLNKLSDDTL